jgi:glycosyltransferase involved in cell wall biosynthesis
LHITGDYPDSTRSQTTVAIKRLIDGLTECDHVIFSLTRTADPRRTMIREIDGKPNQRLVAMHHFGLPFGVGLYRSFKSVAHQIEAFLAENNLRPDIVHSHRLTFDGLAGALISASRRIPHFVSIRGEVESKVLRFKPSYQPLLRQILQDADKIYYVSAWFRPQIEQLAGTMAQKSRPLPNIVANTQSEIKPRTPNRSIVAVANLDIYRKKGIDSLIAAFASVADRLPGTTLEIIGGGEHENIVKVSRLIAATGLGHRIVLRGPIANAAFLAELPNALALALPSRNETFGMVYTEALFAGVPILYGRGTGIDGHLDGLDVGASVRPGDVAGIAAGLVELVERNATLRHAIATAAPELFARFDPERQIASYMADVVFALGVHAGDGALPASHS